MPNPQSSSAALSDDQQFYAGIVYNETSGLRASSDDARKQLQQARDMVACVAVRRSGKGVAKSKIPSEGEKKWSPALAAWEGSASAAQSAGEACLTTTVKHFVIWPSDDLGKTPTKTPSMSASWPYTEASKITQAFGPFSNPAKVGDVPVSDKVYIFFYTGVR